MSRIGLALSGGGFRATLYHLGAIRFFRDAGILEQISHVTSVSGGSIISAHLALNWERYNGNEREFDEVANELLDFIRLDIRNRVVRRFPLAFIANSGRWLVQRKRSRKLTRPGLLEHHYEKFLYGDRCLYELPNIPQFHMLATNVNEGCLCSFTQRGLLLERRLPDGQTRFEQVDSALATIPMAVTASSAFPGFFPPIQLTAADVGAQESQFPTHLFTDGGVYDNLGVRMFRHIQDSWIGQDCPIREADFVDINAVLSAIKSESENSTAPAFRRLADLIVARSSQQSAEELTSSELSKSLWNVVTHDQLYSSPSFADLRLENQQAINLKKLADSGRQLERGDHLWLNRYLADEAWAEVNGNRMFNTIELNFDAVIVSDAGKKFTVSRRRKAGGLIGTALRSSDILMNRVWQLENDHFAKETDFLFAPMGKIVSPADDPFAIHPEIQKQLIGTRTDLDRFNDAEISGLVRHGYGVMRQVCKSRPDLFDSPLPDGHPWDPVSEVASGTESNGQPPAITKQARQLQTSSHRRVFSRLLAVRDWPTYVYLPILLMLFVGLPLIGYRLYKIANRSEMIVAAITHSNPDFELVLEIARQNPVPGEWTSLTPMEVDELPQESNENFRLVTDTRILDMRAWIIGSTDPDHRIVSYRRMQVRRNPSSTGAGEVLSQKTGDTTFSVRQFAFTDQASFRCDSTSLKPVVRVVPGQSATGLPGYVYEFEFDLTFVPEGQDFDIGFEVREPGLQGRLEGRLIGDRQLFFPILAPTDVATMWVLLPEGRPYNRFEVTRIDPQTSFGVETITPTYNFEMPDGSMFGWMMVAPTDGNIYECRWDWRE